MLYSQVLHQRIYQDQDSEIMIIGSGLSDLGAFLYEQGFHYVTNIDVSSVAIKYMSEKHSKFSDMEYAQMDICESSSTPDESFNLVIDKGTLDSLACCEEDQKKAEKMLINVYKMLSPSGSFVCVSRGSPETRLGYL